MQLRRVSSGLHVKRLAAPIPAFIGWVLCFAILSWFWFAPSASTASYVPRAEKPPPYASKSPPVNNSIIVPIYHEAANLRTLVTRISSVLEQAKIKDRTEIVLVDDNSRDGTEEVVGALKLDGFHVILETRKGKNDVKGLSRAVLRGFEVARGSKMVVMDADLQVDCRAGPTCAALSSKTRRCVAHSPFRSVTDFDLARSPSALPSTHQRSSPSSSLPLTSTTLSSAPAMARPGASPPPGHSTGASSRGVPASSPGLLSP